jgi:hypothetical protein
MTNKMQRYHIEVKMELEVAQKSTTRLTPEHWIRLLSGSSQITRPESNGRTGIQTGRNEGKVI